MISDKDVSDHHAIIPTMEIEKADIPALPLGERNLLLLVCCTPAVRVGGAVCV